METKQAEQPELTEAKPEEKPKEKPKEKQPKTQEVAVTVRSLLATDAVRTRFSQVLGSRAPQFMSSILTVMGTNKTLNEVEPHSVIRAAAIAASIDLPITPGLGQAHIVPYKESGVGVAQFQIGWKGLVQLAHRTKQYKTLNATPIYEGQIVRNDPFTGEMEFKAEATSGKVIGYLFYFRLLSGFEKYTYMTVAECEKHGKRYSQTYKRGKGKWVDDFQSMALKTVVKMGLSKWGVLSVDLSRAIEFDQAAVKDDGTPEYIDAEKVKDEEPIKEPKRTDGRK